VQHITHVFSQYAHEEHFADMVPKVKLGLSLNVRLISYVVVLHVGCQNVTLCDVTRDLSLNIRYSER
jgi:hypothetical protein